MSVPHNIVMDLNTVVLLSQVSDVHLSTIILIFDN